MQPPSPVRVVPLLVDVGTVAGHRLTLLSIEAWDGWWDLRFARIDVGSARPLPRRVPPPEAWRVRVDDRDAEVVDAVGRGDRAFSNGEVRLRPALPTERCRVEVEVGLLAGHPALTAAFEI